MCGNLRYVLLKKWESPSLFQFLNLSDRIVSFIFSMILLFYWCSQTDTVYSHIGLAQSPCYREVALFCQFSITAVETSVVQVCFSVTSRLKGHEPNTVVHYWKTVTMWDSAWEMLIKQWHFLCVNSVFMDTNAPINLGNYNETDRLNQ